MTVGMQYPIESFYRSITEETPVPIPYRENLLTARIMDDIFEQLDNKALKVHGSDQIRFCAGQANEI